MKIISSCLYLVFACFSPIMAQYVHMGAKLAGSQEVGKAHQGHSVSLSQDGHTMAVGGYDDDNGVGATWVYILQGNTWTQMGDKLVGNGSERNAAQGYSVSLSANGQTLAIGGTSDNKFQGATWVFTLSGSNWVQMGNKLVGTGGAGDSHQGTVNLSSDGKTLAVGGYGDDSLKGATWVFTLSGNEWIQTGNKLVGTGAIGESNQGQSVSLSSDGKTLAVGGCFDDAGKGATWIYTLIHGNWVQMGNKLVGLGGLGTEHQGFPVSLSADGKILAVGGEDDDNGIGATWVFALSKNKWTEMGNKLVGSEGIGSGHQGSSVNLSSDGKTLAIGGFADNNYVGATWVFALADTNWSQKGGKLVGQGSIGESYQGNSVSLSSDGNTLMVGGEGDNGGVGATWIFTNTSMVTGFEDQEGNKIPLSMNVYPNPFNQSITIESPEKSSYILYDVKGNEVETGTTTSSNIGGRLNSGIYHLKVNAHVFRVLKTPL